MKNVFSSFKGKVLSSHISEEENMNESKSTNINILLNRVKLVQKKESRQKLLFSAIASLGLVLFGVLIF